MKTKRVSIVVVFDFDCHIDTVTEDIVLTNFGDLTRFKTMKGLGDNNVENGTSTQSIKNTDNLWYDTILAEDVDLLDF